MGQDSGADRCEVAWLHKKTRGLRAAYGPGFTQRKEIICFLKAKVSKYANYALVSVANIVFRIFLPLCVCVCVCVCVCALRCVFLEVT